MTNLVHATSGMRLCCVGATLSQWRNDMLSDVSPVQLSAGAKLMLAVLKQKNEWPGMSGTFTLVNFGTEPSIGTVYIDADPGELAKPVEYAYKQIGRAIHVSGTPPHATYEAEFEALRVPTPRTFLQVIAKMNEGQFLRLGPNDKGICTVPASRRRDVLRYLGFEMS